jgi:hypothetical protein
MPTLLTEPTTPVVLALVVSALVVHTVILHAVSSWLRADAHIDHDGITES